VKPMLPQKILKTFDALTRHPDLGTVVVFESEGEIIGYALLVNFWSNEFGGKIIVIDELYIKRGFRSKGIGTSFIRNLAENSSGDSAALQLEVTPGNMSARRLYENLGFKSKRNETLILDLE